MQADYDDMDRKSSSFSDSQREFMELQAWLQQQSNDSPPAKTAIVRTVSRI